MPFQRPTLTEQRALVQQDIAAALPGSDPLLRFSVLRILGDVLAGVTHMQFGYLDYIARQATPYTAEDEWLEAWAALKQVFRVPAAQASGTVRFTGTNGLEIPAGTPLVRGDGVGYKTTAAGTVTGGQVTVPAQADADPTGVEGAFGNMAAGGTLTLGTVIGGIQSAGVVLTAFTGGADLELDDSLRARMLAAFQDPAHGGAANDYVGWAREVPGVTRAWCVPNGMGPGTVQVFVMLDLAQAAHDGFPQGTNGVATLETRDTPATGDQLIVANAIFDKRPATARVYVVAPGAHAVPFTISGLAGASTALKNEVKAAIAGTFLQHGTLGGTVALSYVESAIAAVAGTAGFVIEVPGGNISTPAGQIPVLGAVTWT